MLLIDGIHDISMYFSTVYVIVDGLDECKNRAHIGKLILKLVAPKIRVLITSRPESVILSVFPDKTPLEITQDVSYADIYTHLNWAFETSDCLKAIKPALKNDIKLHLMSKSSEG